MLISAKPLLLAVVMTLVLSLSLLLSLASSSSQVEAMTTKVSAGDQFCVTEKVDKDVPVSFRFKVTAGGKLDLDVEVFDASGISVQQWTLATTGQYQLRGDSQNNRFKFCFSNQMAKWTPKWVSFYIRKGVHPAVAPKERVDPIESQILRLSGKINNDMRDVHDLLATSEHDHRNTIEDVNERVLLWSLIQTGVLVVMGGVQIFFIKRFLEVRSSV